MENADLTKKLGPSFSPRCLNLKLEEKRQECEDNILYYTQREAELEAKIDELMTRLQEQTAAYMKLQSEFDNYEWWEEGEGGLRSTCIREPSPLLHGRATARRATHLISTLFQS